MTLYPFIGICTFEKIVFSSSLSQKWVQLLTCFPAQALAIIVLRSYLASLVRLPGLVELEAMLSSCVGSLTFFPICVLWLRHIAGWEPKLGRIKQYLTRWSHWLDSADEQNHWLGCQFRHHSHQEYSLRSMSSLLLAPPSLLSLVDFPSDL